MCRGAKPLLGEDIYRLREGAGAKKSPPLTSVADLHAHLKPLRISDPPPPVSSPTHAVSAPPISTPDQQFKWACSVCTYENWPRARKCTMCSSPGPPTSPPRIVDDNSTYNTSKWYQRRRQQQIQQQHVDWSWLNACVGVVQGDPSPVEAFLKSGGDPTRQLSPQEVAILNRPSAFDIGHTLVHLAIRFHREEMLATLVSGIESGCGGGGSGLKRVPSYVAPELATAIRRHTATIFSCGKKHHPHHHHSKFTTFTLPAEIEDLPVHIQEQLFEELLDRDAQQELESDPAVINWSVEVTVQLGSRLYALWNRSQGDCLLDSLMQVTWGIFDRDNLLRRALADTLNNAGHLFYSRWCEYEASQARQLDFSLSEAQWAEDWSALVRRATQPGASLQQLHVFTLAHILRRPIIVYGVKFVKSFRGENLGYAGFEGVYLPLVWEGSFCSRSPVCLGYTRGHFSALVPIEPSTTHDNLQVTFLPLVDSDRKLLPIHFITKAEVIPIFFYSPTNAGSEERLLREWLDVNLTSGGLLVAQQKRPTRPLLVAQMLQEWLNHYRRLA
ncbi:hypothetical protein AAG570_009599 [Ranatra chinensis]|uniref:ubiquitinyl hydrolase 1 n=1 Tax=Ranatra chinensis TaxID=642074 RepID=A0ABD0YPI9_9HEMI